MTGDDLTIELERLGLGAVEADEAAAVQASARAVEPLLERLAAEDLSATPVDAWIVYGQPPTR